MIGHRPGDDPPRVDVQHERQMEESFVGLDVGYVRRPEPVRGGEVSVYEIGGRRSPGIRASDSLLPPALAASDSGFTHQSGHPAPSTTHPKGLQLRVHPRITVGLAAPVMHLHDPLRKGGVLLGSFGGRPVSSGVVAALRDSDHPAQQRDGKVCLLRVDEPKTAHRPPISSLAKKAAVGSTGQCNTLGFRCCLNRRCGSGEAGSSWRVVGSGQEGAVEAVEGRGGHQRHRPGTTKASPGSIHGMLEATGGISPPERRRRRCALTPCEREEISRGLAAGESLRTIAARLGRCASTVCREVNRNGGRRNYRAQKADERAWERARRPKRCLLAMNHFLRDVVAQKIREDWSPEQISGWLKREYPEDQAMRISHETIYRTLFVQARGALKRELLAHLRSRRMMRKGRRAS